MSIKLAFFSPLPPARSGIADYSAALLDELGKLVEVETFSSKPSRFDPHEWSRVEITADASNGTAHMTVAQPVSAQPVEVLEFKDPSAGKAGPIDHVSLAPDRVSEA